MGRVRSSLAIFMLCLGLGNLAGCDRDVLQAAAPPPPAVTVAMPLRMDAALWQEFTGTTAAMQTAEIRARVEGYLLEQRFEDSDDVVAGQILFEIDPSLYQAEVDRTVAVLSQRQAQFAQAEWDLQQVQQLAARGASTAKEVQDRTTDRALTDAAVKSAQAAVQKAELDLGYTKVRSPIAGRISRNLVDVGNLVAVGIVGFVRIAAGLLFGVGDGRAVVQVVVDTVTVGIGRDD